MALKGNLLYNGDFETGDTTGWNSNPFGLSDEHDFFASSPAAYRGNYGGTLLAGEDAAYLYLMYEKMFSFEEYEAYLYTAYINSVNGNQKSLVIYGLDDKGNLEGKHYVAYNNDENVWEKHLIMIRGFYNYTHFKVGMFCFGLYAGDKHYIDVVELIPLKSVESYTLSKFWEYKNVTSSFYKYVPLGLLGKGKIISIINVDNVSGTDPTLDIRITVGQAESVGLTMQYSHSQFTTKGSERIEHSVENVGQIFIEYDVGGTSPSFDFKHAIYLAP